MTELAAVSFHRTVSETIINNLATGSIDTKQAQAQVNMHKNLKVRVLWLGMSYKSRIKLPNICTHHFTLFFVW